MSYVVIEGMDNQGKSTLVQKLAHDLKTCKVATYRKPKCLADVQDYSEWLRKCPFPLILDRHPLISELIYGTVLGRGAIVTEDYSRRELAREGILVVHCRPMQAPLFDEREQMEGVIENAAKLYLMYDSFMETIPHTIYNWLNYEEVRDVVAAHLCKTA